MPTSLPLSNGLSASATVQSLGQNKVTNTAKPVSDGNSLSFKQSLQTVAPPAKMATKAMAADTAVAPVGDAAVIADESHAVDGELSALNVEPPPIFLTSSAHKPFASGPAFPSHLSYLGQLAGVDVDVTTVGSSSPTQTAAIDGAVMVASGIADFDSPILDGLTDAFAALNTPALTGAEPSPTNPVASAALFANSASMTLRPLQGFGSGQSKHQDIANSMMEATTPKLMSGKFLPLGLPGQGDPIFVSPAHAGPNNLEMTKGAVSLDAALLSGPVLSTTMKSPSAEFKALLAENINGQSLLSAALPGESAAAIGRATDTFQQMLSAPGAGPAAAPALHLEGRAAIPMTVAFGHAQWANGLAERTAWAVGQAIHTAEIQLDPPELGPLQVRIHVNQDQASVSFVSANPLVRDAVEQTMGRLRELLQEQGLNLVDSGVADQHSRQQHDDADPSEPRAGVASTDGDGSQAIDPDLQTVVTAVPWGVDYYA